MQALIAKYRGLTAQEHEEVKALGGLHIIGTERHESRRIDNQLRGRSGRQGDPAAAAFIFPWKMISCVFLGRSM